MATLHLARGVLLRPPVVGFPARAADDLAGHHDGARDLVVGEVPRAVGTELLERGRGAAGSEGHDRGHLLSPAHARRPDDERVPDGRMALHDALDLLREDLLAAGVDARGVAAEEDERPVLREARAVAADAVADAVDHGERLARAVRVAEVAEREMATGGDPADLVHPGP